MKTLYLHIGTPKTGTTSLQGMMANNRPLLKKYGLSYPDLGFRYPEILANRNAHFLIAPVMNADGSCDRSRLSADYEAGLDMLVPLSETCDAVLLSDEGIYCSSQFRPDFWSRLKKDLETRGFSLKIILYLRRQDLFLESLYAQRVRQHHCAAPFDQFVRTTLQEEPPYELNYYSYLEHIAAVTGRENLIVRVFEKERFDGINNSLYSDFLQIFGLTPEEFVIEKERKNTSLGGEYLEIKRILNKLPSDRPEQHLIAQNMVQLTGITHPGYDPKQKYSYFAQEARAEFLSRYEESNRQVARVYLRDGDGILFHGESSSFPVYATNERDLLYCTILAYGDTIEKMSNEIKSLRSRLNRLERYSFFLRLDNLRVKILKKLHLMH